MTLCWQYSELKFKLNGQGSVLEKSSVALAETFVRTQCVVSSGLVKKNNGGTDR